MKLRQAEKSLDQIGAGQHQASQQLTGAHRHFEDVPKPAGAAQM